LAVPDLARTSAYSVSISFGSDANQYYRIWIDFNQNGIFETTESFGNDANAGSNGTATVTFSVPLGAVLGQTRMRVRGGNDAVLTNAQSCGAGTSAYGEVEDYLVNITAAPACQAVSGLGSSSVTSATATVAWSTVSAGDAYEWELRKVSSGTSCGDLLGIEQSGATADIATVSINLASLDPSTEYTFCVRNVCGFSASSSVWSSTTFTTPCAPVTSFPYLEDFESITLSGTSTTVFPACLAKTNVSGTAIKTGSNGSLMSGFSYPVIALSGTKAAFATYGTTNWIHTAPMSLTGGTTYYFSFS